MPVTVLFFGQLTDITATHQVILENIQDTDQLLQQLQQRYPALRQAPYVLAVEKHVIAANTALQENDTVALLPPYAGG